MNASSHRIMILEDEYIIADQIRNFLQNEGFVILPIADNYSDAINILNKYTPDLVIADIRLHDDYDAGLRVGKYIGDNFKIPVVYLSGYSDQETIERARQTNPNTFLIKPKPLEKDQLLTTIKMALPSPKDNFKYTSPILIKGRKFSIFDEKNNRISKNDLMHFKIDIQKICIIESFNHVIKNTIVIRTVDENINYLIREEIESFLDALPSNFLRIHKSYIISTNNVSGIKFPQFVTVKDRKIPIGEYYKKMIESQMPHLSHKSSNIS